MVPFDFFSMFWCKKFDDFLAKTLVEFILKNKNFPTFWLQKQQNLSKKKKALNDSRSKPTIV